MPLPRFRLRTLMIAVAVTALAFGGQAMRRRSEKFHRQAQAYRGFLRTFPGEIPPEARAWTEKVIAESERIARYPWLLSPEIAPMPADVGVPPAPEPLPGPR
jgi:hypothetical protein